MKSHAFSAFRCFTAALVLLAPALRAAPVAWVTSTVAGPGDVSTLGTLVGALNVGRNAAETVNGVMFAADAGGPGAIAFGPATATFSFQNAHSDYLVEATVGGSAPYAAALDYGRWTDDTTTGTVTLGGLGAGRKYQVQLWITDSRGCCNTRTRTVKGDEATATATNSAGPQIATGTFTATGTTQVITIAGMAGGHGPQLNLLQLREVATLVQPSAITSSTSASDVSPAVNLINGSGLTPASPTLAALGSHASSNNINAWVTATSSPTPDYFVSRPPPVLTCTLSPGRLVSELVLWGFDGNSSEAKSFNVAFSTDNGTSFANAVLVTQPALLGTGAVRLPLPEGPRLASHVRVTVTDNHFGTGVGGDRVVLGELRFAAAPEFFVMNTADSGPGSLRQAIADAAAAPGADTITFAPALSGQTISLGSEIVISSSVEINATSLPAGLTITDTGNVNYRLFSVSSGTTVTLRGLTLANGGGSSFTGDGGAISNNGTLTLTQCSLSGNSANFGGAIANFGTLTLTQCTLSGNSASRGGAIRNNGTLTLTQCSLSGNSSADDGGAINSGSGALTLTQCTLSGNSTLFSGGAIFNVGALTLTNTLVAGNTAPVGGPDIYRVAGTITPTGVNLIGDLSNSGLSAGPNVLVGAPHLAPLGNYGGPTQTMALLPGSPARNAAGPAIPNPSFEADTFTANNGYADGNGGTITGWTLSDPGTIGLNPATTSFFANNGAIPDGANVAFIQNRGGTPSLSTTITGLTSGVNYTVTFRTNAREGYPAPTTAWSLNGGADVAFNCGPAVGGTNPYRTVQGTFTATGPTALLVIKNTGGGGDSVLLDAFTIAQTGTSPLTTDQRGFPIVGTPDIGAYEAGTVSTNYNAWIYETLPATATAPQHATTFDFDSDGQTNHDEWLALTNPANPASLFTITMGGFSGGNLLVSYPTVTGRNYAREYSTDLSTWTTGNIGAGDGNVHNVAFGPITGFPRFYVRVKTSLP